MEINRIKDDPEELEIKKDSVGTEEIYSWQCPKCAEHNTTYDDPYYTESYYCESCDNEVKLID